MGERAERWRYRMVLKAGIGCSAIVVLLLGVTAALNFDRLQSAYDTQVEALARLKAVQSAIQSKEAASNVAVFEKRRLRRPPVVDLPSSILSVELVNPPFLEELSDDGLRKKALEIAQVAWGAYRPPRDFEAVEVVLTSRSGVFITFRSRRRFLIRADEIALQTDESPERLGEAEALPPPGS